jgi:hypothetical protein
MVRRPAPPNRWRLDGPEGGSHFPIAKSIEKHNASDSTVRRPAFRIGISMKTSIKGYSK